MLPGNPSIRLDDRSIHDRQYRLQNIVASRGKWNVEKQWNLSFFAEVESQLQEGEIFFSMELTAQVLDPRLLTLINLDNANN